MSPTRKNCATGPQSNAVTEKRLDNRGEGEFGTGYILLLHQPLCTFPKVTLSMVWIMHSYYTIPLNSPLPSGALLNSLVHRPFLLSMRI